MKTSHKNLQNEVNTIEKALQHLADYQYVFDMENEEGWYDLQETMRELYVLQIKLQKEK